MTSFHAKMNILLNIKSIIICQKIRQRLSYRLEQSKNEVNYNKISECKCTKYGSKQITRVGYREIRECTIRHTELE